MQKRYFKRKQTSEEISYWQSYSDMMAALLLIFVLIISFTMYESKSEIEIERKQLLEQEIVIKKQRDELAAQNELYRVQQQAIEEQTNQIENLIGIKRSLIKALNEAFSDTDLSISIDAKTGTITFDSDVLFDVNSYELKPGSISVLKEFLPKYFAILMDPAFKDYISEIIIEGHTAKSDNYLISLELSQQRALAVANFALVDGSSVIDAQQLSQLRKIVTANGRSWSDLKYDSNGEYMFTASRRVEIKFRLKDDEMIQEMINVLGKSE